MKPNRKTWALLISLVFTVGAFAKSPMLRLTLEVADAAGQPVEGALATLAAEHGVEQPASEATHTRARGATDTHGRFSAEIEVDDLRSVSFRIERNGYAPKRSALLEKFEIVNGRWEPWAPTINVTLVRIPSVELDKDPDKQPPTIPGDLRVVKTTIDSISLKWKASRDNVKVSGYLVYRDGQPINTPQSIRETSFTDTNLPEGEEFEYSVRAFDYAGNVSHLTDSVLGKTQPAKADGEQQKQSSQSIPWNKPENWKSEIPGPKAKTK